jgi:transcriptional regulator of aromatic amino acid metabolism
MMPTKWTGDGIPAGAGGDTNTNGATNDPHHHSGGEIEAPHLIVAMECRRPLATGLRLSLAGVDEVRIGRGSDRRADLTGRRIDLLIGDLDLSRQHAWLRRVAGGWTLSDAGSKNGTVLNGAPAMSAPLTDGDLIEIGATLLVFRGEVAMGHVSGDLDLTKRKDLPAAFRTVSLDFERTIFDVEKIARSEVPVLVLGETGTGKELIARAIHERSGRRGAFVALNCGALPRQLIESELFGYRRGAFSEAKDDRAGLVKSADGGTLFLDEIAELPPESQVALLRVLQEGEVRPIGSTETVRVDVRIVAATHQDLVGRIAEGRFRQDLYARLSGFEVALPPLRDRKEDVGTLVASLLPRMCEAPERITFHRVAARSLHRYSYPNNIRELEQAIRSAIVLAEGREIRTEHLPAAIRNYTPAPSETVRPGDPALHERLVALLREHHGNVAAVGRVMDKAPLQIRRWCARLGIQVPAYRHGLPSGDG